MLHRGDHSHTIQRAVDAGLTVLPRDSTTVLSEQLSMALEGYARSASARWLTSGGGDDLQAAQMAVQAGRTAFYKCLPPQWPNHGKVEAYGHAEAFSGKQQEFIARVEEHLLWWLSS